MAVLEPSLGVMAPLRFRQERMRAAALEGYVTATSVADALVERGVPFRSAHGIVGRLVAEAEALGMRLDELPAASFAAAFSGEEPAPASPAALRAAGAPGSALARPRGTR